MTDVSQPSGTYDASWNGWEVSMTIADRAFELANVGDKEAQDGICAQFRRACAAGYGGDCPKWVNWAQLRPGLTRTSPMADMLF